MFVVVGVNGLDMKRSRPIGGYDFIYSVSCCGSSNFELIIFANG